MTDTISPEVGKTYLTRDGRKARCICTDMLGSEYSVVCLVGTEGSEITASYTADGCFYSDDFIAGFDLVSEAPRVVTVESVRAAARAEYEAELREASTKWHEAARTTQDKAD